MDNIITALVTALTTLGAAGLAYLTARKMGRLGLGPAQQKLNDTLTDLNSAYEARIEGLEADVTRLTAELVDARGEADRRRRENMDLRQDMDDLRAEVRDLRAVKQGAG